MYKSCCQAQTLLQTKAQTKEQKRKAGKFSLQLRLGKLLA